MILTLLTQVNNILQTEVTTCSQIICFEFFCFKLSYLLKIHNLVTSSCDFGTDLCPPVCILTCVLDEWVFKHFVSI